MFMQGVTEIAPTASFFASLSVAKADEKTGRWGRADVLTSAMKSTNSCSTVTPSRSSAMF
jgi:hypothetical protein